MYASALEILRRRPSIGALVIRVAAAYVLVGAVAKVFWGAPSDLPQALLHAVPLDPEVLFDLVIAVELLCAVMALVAPRLGWPIVAAVLIGFIGVLVQQLRAGELSCGCFGTAVTAPAWLMLSIDSVALLGVILIQPWSSLRSTPWRAWAIIPAPLVAAAGLWYVHWATIAPVGGAVDRDDSVLVSQSETDTPDAEPEIMNPRSAPEAPTPSSPIEDSSEDSIEEPTPAWRLPARLPRIIALRPREWINQPLRECALATWADTSKMPEDCTLIFYYDTCTHCAEHIEAKADSAAQVDYVFIQLPTARNSRYPRVVRELPRGLHVKLPAGPRWQIETPWDVVVRNGIVIDAIKGF